MLKPDRTKIDADGEDLSMIAVEIQDREGRVVPVAGNEVTFQVSGAGRPLGVCNGDPSSHESDHAEKRSAFQGLCMAIVQSTRQPGEIRVNASSAGLESASLIIECRAAKLRPSVP